MLYEEEISNYKPENPPIHFKQLPRLRCVTHSWRSFYFHNRSFNPIQIYKTPSTTHWPSHPMLNTMTIHPGPGWPNRRWSQESAKSLPSIAKRAKSQLKPPFEKAQKPPLFSLGANSEKPSSLKGRVIPVPLLGIVGDGGENFWSSCSVELTPLSHSGIWVELSKGQKEGGVETDTHVPKFKLVTTVDDTSAASKHGFW